MRSIQEIASKFWALVLRGDGCWEYQGRLTKDGYGRIGFDYRDLLAHRVSWALTHGSLADEDCVLHRCDNRRCVRPDHLFLGDRIENNRDMKQKGRARAGAAPAFQRSKTHCPVGHEYTPANTMVRSRGGRECRACYRDRNNRAYARRTLVRSYVRDRPEDMRDVAQAIALPATARRKREVKA